MVNLSKYQKTNVENDGRKLPMLNSLFIERFSEFTPSTRENDFKGFVKWARRSAPIMGFYNIIATDMLSDEIQFSTEDKVSGRNRIMSAEKFWNENLGVEVAEETIYDLLITGIGYNWIGVLDDKQIKEAIKKTYATGFPETKEHELEFKAEDMLMVLKKKKKEKFVRKLRHVAASTVSIHTDQYEPIKYIQRVGVNSKHFSPEEMIVFKLMPFDGKVYPFAPMEAILAEVYLLWLITQNQVSFFENGGKPDNVFMLPKEIAGSKNHEYLIETLKKYKKIQNKHGNLVFTGELSIESLQKAEQQMENKDLALYIVGILAMLYGIPSSRIPFLVGKAAAGGDAGGLADSGYWRKISVWQSKLEIKYNSKLFLPFFNVKMKFRRGYLQDEVRETQTEMQKVQIAEQKLSLGLWTVEEAGRSLGVDEEEVKRAQEQKKKREEDEMKSGMLAQNLNTNNDVMKEPDAKLKAKKKKETQDKNKTANGGTGQKP